MTDAGGGFRCKKITPGRREEFQRGLLLERRRVRKIDDDLRPGERGGQPFSRDGVHSGVRRRRKHVVSLFPQPLHSL